MVHRWLPALVVLAWGCSSDSTPGNQPEADASTLGNDGGETSEPSSSDTDTSSTTETSSTGSETSSDTETSETSTTVADAGPDADTDADVPQCEALGTARCGNDFDCDDYSSMDYDAALGDLQLRCDDFAYQKAYAGEGCGYLILKYAFGAGDTFMAFYDEDSHEVVGWRFAGDAGSGACAGEVPSECFEYGFDAPPDGEQLCLDAGTPTGDADADLPDADVPDADLPDADMPDADSPDATAPDGAADASDAAQ